MDPFSDTLSSSLSSDTFCDHYRALVGQLLRPLGKSGGCSEAEISAAEQRLGLRLPRLLREFFRLAGKREDINGVFHRLLAPDELYVSDGVLAFYEENQNVCLWGVDVRDSGLDDPAVLREDNTDAPVWEPDFDRLSEFLIAMLLMQAVNGGMRHCGVGKADGMRIAQAAPEWEVVQLGGSWNHRVLLRDGQALYVFGDEPIPEVFGGARTKRAFLALEKVFDVSWDYCTLDDE